MMTKSSNLSTTYRNCQQNFHLIHPNSKSTDFRVFICEPKSPNECPMIVRCLNSLTFFDPHKEFLFDGISILLQHGILRIHPDAHSTLLFCFLNVLFEQPEFKLRIFKMRDRRNLCETGQNALDQFYTGELPSWLKSRWSKEKI